MKIFIEAIWPSFRLIGQGISIAGLSIPSMITFLLFWSMNILIIYKGMEAVKNFENWAAPLVLVMAAILLVWAVSKAGGLGPMLSQPSRFNSFGEFWAVFIPSLTGMIGYWATLSINIPDLTRFGRGQKEQMLGQILGLPTTMLGFCAIGVFVTSASKQIMPEVDIAELWDPVFILSQITSSQPPKGLDQPLVSSPFLRFIIAVTSLFGIAVSCVSVNIAGNVVSSANDFGNLAPKYISFKTGGLITGLIGILIMPWKLMDSADVYIFEWLVGYSALMGPIAGIMIVDYWLIRETDLMIDDLYRYDGRYPRFQLSSIISLVLSVAPNVPGFIRSASGISTKSNFFDIIYSYAWFIGFFLAGCLHYVMATTKLNY